MSEVSQKENRGNEEARPVDNHFVFADSHIHYDDPKFDQDRDSLLKAVYEAGCHAVINCATDLKSCEKTLKLMEKYPFVYGAMGVHPHDVKGLTVDDLEEIFAYATSHPKVVAIGEIGLDYHYDFSPRDMQQDFFCEQCELAIELEKPVIVHSREAVQDTFDIVSEYAQADLTGVIHSYTGNLEMAEKYVDMGFYLGIGGMLTFPDVKKILRTVKEIPLTSLLLETDGPYLAPVPNRGKRNDSRNIPFVAQKIAELKEISVEEVYRVTNANMEKLFGIKVR
ncbi:MAG: TatD family hydrolase [Firmicutes bacterium]|nr:TatD family hydrolase [Bacillota bacterium]